MTPPWPGSGWPVPPNAFVQRGEQAVEVALVDRAFRVLRGRRLGGRLRISVVADRVEDRQRPSARAVRRRRGRANHVAGLPVRRARRDHVHAGRGRVQRVPARREQRLVAAAALLCGCQNADEFGSVQIGDVADRRIRAQDVRDEAAVRRAPGGVERRRGRRAGHGEDDADPARRGADAAAARCGRFRTGSVSPGLQSSVDAHGTDAEVAVDREQRLRVRVPAERVVVDAEDEPGRRGGRRRDTTAASAAARRSGASLADPVLVP